MRDRDYKAQLACWPDPLVDGGEWRRLRNTGGKYEPYLFVPGSREFSLVPDGLYGHFVCDEENYLEFADVFAIEICGSRQNFYDKRSRYAEQNPLGLYCRPEWLKSASFLQHIADKELQNIPVRYRAVLYALSEDEFQRCRKNVSPWGNEYFADQGQLQSLSTAIGRFVLPDARFVRAEIG